MSPADYVLPLVNPRRDFCVATDSFEAQINLKVSLTASNTHGCALIVAFAHVLSRCRTLSDTTSQELSNTLSSTLFGGSAKFLLIYHVEPYVLSA
jgi:hypothetical protein